MNSIRWKKNGAPRAWIIGLFVGVALIAAQTHTTSASDLQDNDLGDSPQLADIRAEAKQDPRKPLALVWRGPGVCQPACGIAAAQTARSAGFRTLSVFPGFNNEAAWNEARLWVQPGGKSVIAAASMGPELMARIRRFIADGAGYVGFCAGMFISTDRIGTSNKTGFGIIPGSTELFDKNDAPGHMLWVTLPNGKVLKTYYAGGPFLHVNETELASLGGRVTARYADGSVAGVFVPFGKGKVSVVGFHPEAGWWWKIFRGIFDFRGESWLVREMIRSVTPSN